MTTPRNLFGEAIERALNELVRIVTDAAATGNPDRIQAIFESLRPFDGAMHQLRGPFFELLTGHCLLSVEEGRVDIDYDVVDPSTREATNIDVLHRKGLGFLTAYECKGKLSASSVSSDEVKDWLRRQVPRIYGYLRSQDEFKNRKITFAFWTTGVFSPGAQRYLSEMKTPADTKYSLEWKDGQGVRQYAQKNGLSKMVRLLDDYFRSAP
ncbi:MAG TPA: hypothetical protein VHQ90_16520 [Thermoanaerobaculia bacterium]|nr:hypothetical protein [Thermoanaerobaculia bacterium]